MSGSPPQSKSSWYYRLTFRIILGRINGIMKLKQYSATIDEKMAEFDLWVTPSLGDIRETDEFTNVMNRLVSGLDALASLTDNFASSNSCSAEYLTSAAIKHIESLTVDETEAFLNVVFEALLLTTGKTDNNLKCQFHKKLVSEYDLDSIQIVKNGNVRLVKLPRTFELSKATKYIALLKGNQTTQRNLLKAYLELVVSDAQYSLQLYSIGLAYLTAKNEGRASALLCTFAIFHSRGSITATQGHIPETILREYMNDWGMVAEIDYNANDVDFEELLDSIPHDTGKKKRKYDFILPFNTDFEGSRIFVQCQFYAGDSGSVSHKVVDQTDSSRNVTLQKFPNAVFVEYLDGAGYYASLNGDLKKMLLKSTTKNFFQIKTAPIKLRRELQSIQFLTLLEVEHAIVSTDGKKESVRCLLTNENYSEETVNSTIEAFVRDGKLACIGDVLTVQEERKVLIRRYCMLDMIANIGELQHSSNRNRGVLLIPGYSQYYGSMMSAITKKALSIEQANTLWVTPQDAVDDIQWLIEKGFVKNF